MGEDLTAVVVPAEEAGPSAWQQQERSRHESELEQLRLYFEEKLREAEQSYQEDLTLLQRRLQEGRDDSLLEAMGTR